MECMQVILTVLAVFGIPYLLILLADYYRIKDEVEANGGRLIKARWRLMDDNGNWGDKQRTFYVTYIDALGNTVIRYCRTSMGRGNVHWQ